MSTPDQDRVFFNAFNLVGQIGSVRMRRLLNAFPSPAEAWHAGLSELTASGLEERIALAVIEARNTFDPETEFQRLEEQKIGMFTINDENYPKLLKEIPNPPAALYIRGQILPQDEMAVAVVGSRKCSPYGKRAAIDLVRDLTRANITIVSGLALGLDHFAHQAALEYHGRTIAVLPCGLDSIYPASNRFLASTIEQQGALISEFALGTPPLKHHFPHRNRIISGLTLGTVVVEAAVDSGALITAQHALEQNRQVFAVPGSIYSESSEGTNNLLKMGAKVTTGARDILEDLNLTHLQEQLLTEEITGDTDEERLILTCLSREPIHADEIAKDTKLNAGALAAALVIMEMKGKIRNVGANQYVKSR